MSEQKHPPGGENRPGTKPYYDLTEEASKRPGGEEATDAAREAETLDDFNGENNNVLSKPQGDDWAENKVAVSDDD